jgi:hypothetical protein
MKIKIESVRYFQKQLLNKQEVSEKNNRKTYYKNWKDSCRK